MSSTQRLVFEYMDFHASRLVSEEGGTRTPLATRTRNRSHRITFCSHHVYGNSCRRSEVKGAEKRDLSIPPPVYAFFIYIRYIRVVAESRTSGTNN